MTTYTKTLTASQIKAVNPTGLMTMSYIYPTTFITFENSAVFAFDNSNAANKSFAKLSKMGFGRASNFSSDESEGIIAADKNGESAFDFKIIAL